MRSMKVFWLPDQFLLGPFPSASTMVSTRRQWIWPENPRLQRRSRAGLTPASLNHRAVAICERAPGQREAPRGFAEDCADRRPPVNKTIAAVPRRTSVAGRGGTPRAPRLLRERASGAKPEDARCITPTGSAPRLRGEGGGRSPLLLPFKPPSIRDRQTPDPSAAVNQAGPARSRQRGGIAKGEVSPSPCDETAPIAKQTRADRRSTWSCVPWSGTPPCARRGIRARR